MDASSLAIECTARNNDTVKTLRFSEASLAACIQEMRVFMSGVEVERVQDSSRLHETLQRGLQLEKRINNLDLEFGVARHGTTGATVYNGTTRYIHAEEIAAGGTAKVFHRPLHGICQQKCFVP